MRSLTSQPPTLEELFLRHYGDELIEDGERTASPMTGTGVFLQTFLRRDRWMLLWWALGAMLLYWSQAVSVDGLYATQAEFDRAAASLMESNAAFDRAWPGPARALNTIGGQVAWQATAFGAIVAGLMSMFLVGRHTRAEEESGRDELVRAAAVGRQAPTTAALVTALLANLVLGVLVALSLVLGTRSRGRLARRSASGSPCAAGSSRGSALVAAQLTSSTRAMYGIAGAVIGLAYALRAIGDVGNAALSWLSPIGWYQGMHAFSGLRWWPALLLARGRSRRRGGGVRRVRRRDFGSGVLAARPGPAHAGRGLRAAGSASPGASSAARWSAGRSACSSPAWPTARSATTWATCSATAADPRDVRRRAAATSSTASTRPRC